MRTLNAEQ
jgi:hypothetical protein